MAVAGLGVPGWAVWVAGAAAVAALSAVLALVESPRTRRAILLGVSVPIALAVALYLGYFVLFPGG